MDVIQIIEMLLAERGITQTKMSRDIGLSSGIYSQWKAGKQKPSAENLLKIADYFNVSVDYLLGNEAAREIRDEDLRFALFDGDKEITPAMLDEVKAFAKWVQDRENKNK